jgi:uncharacterized protein (DUF427 family)
MTRATPIKLNPGQESVWDYPRPPCLERTSRHIQVVFNKVVVADSRRAWRVLETSHPPVYYVPPEDVKMEILRGAEGGSWCEWKGQAAYLTIEIGSRIAERVAWTYRRPTTQFRAIKDHVAFYAWAMDECRVDGELVRTQPGKFYGGWITNDIVGPFKGEAGTTGW